MPFADLPGVRMLYGDEGQGPPVLLVHGWSCDGNDWCYQVPALVEAGFRAISVDLRGHGNSSAPEGRYGPRIFADDLAALLDQLNTGPVVAAGHSMGGATVVALAVEHPAKVRAVVPVDSAYGFGEGFRGQRDAFIAGLSGPAGMATAKQLFSGFYPPASPVHLKAWHVRRLESVPRHVLVAAFEGMLSPDGFGFKPESEQYLRRVAVPALAFRAGNQDPSEVARWEREQFQHPKSKAVGWEGTGHFLHQERPAEFNAILLEWLKGLE
jgi:pimeloyl-ACP methyl ester carboxylesterase